VGWSGRGSWGKGGRATKATIVQLAMERVPGEAVVLRVHAWWRDRAGEGLPMIKGAGRAATDDKRGRAEGLPMPTRPRRGAATALGKSAPNGNTRKKRQMK
jgi:hypothetical protein